MADPIARPEKVAPIRDDPGVSGAGGGGTRAAQLMTVLLVRFIAERLRRLALRASAVLAPSAPCVAAAVAPHPLRRSPPCGCMRL